MYVCVLMLSKRNKRKRCIVPWHSQVAHAMICIGLCAFCVLYLQAELASQLEQVQGALMNKSMELTEATASLRQAAAEEKESLLEKHGAERSAAAKVCGCDC